MTESLRFPFGANYLLVNCGSPAGPFLSFASPYPGQYSPIQYRIIWESLTPRQFDSMLKNFVSVFMSSSLIVVVGFVDLRLIFS